MIWAHKWIHKKPYSKGKIDIYKHEENIIRFQRNVSIWPTLPYQK
jgi:hypothetical protein